MRPRWIKAPDGRRVPFDARRVHAAIDGAAREAGEGVMVDELVELVVFLIEKRFPSGLPTTGDLEDLVERVLLETNHPRTAAAYLDRQEARGKSRVGLTVAKGDDPPLAPDGELPAEPWLAAWNDGEIARSLHDRLGVEMGLASEVAAKVEERVLALGVPRVTTTLVRELVDLELQDRGHHIRLKAPRTISVPTNALKNTLHAAYVRRRAELGLLQPSPESVVGGDLIRRYLLDEVYPPEVARAHREGAIHIRDLGRPLRVASGALALEHLKLELGRSAPKSAAELAVAVAGLLDRAAPFHGRAVGLPLLNVFLAPLTRGRETAVRRDLREAYRILAAAAPRVNLRIHLGRVPAALADQTPIGRGGKRWRAGYGELAGESERLARLLLEVAAEESIRLGPRRPSFVLDAPDPPVERLEGVDALVLCGGGWEPPTSAGLAPVRALLGEPKSSPLVAGAAQVCGLSFARAALSVGSGDAPAFREVLLRSVEAAVAALASGFSFLERFLYRPRLPLWDADAERPKPEVVPADRATLVLGLIGVDEAFERLLGERPDQNEAVLEEAASTIREVHRHATELAARQGLTIRIEEPRLSRGAQRLAELDVVAFGEDARRLLADRPDVRYGSGILPSELDAGRLAALLTEVYAPLALAPVAVGSRRALERAAEVFRGARAGLEPTAG